MEIASLGLTDTVTFCVFVQPFAVSVYLYVTVFTEVVVLVSISVTSPVPLAAASEILVTVARDQLNVVPETLLVAV
jgi:hypothetical protein